MPKIRPDCIIYLFRHPLDVFLSAQNYLFHKADKLSVARRNDIFKAGRPSSVEQAFINGDMDYYLKLFIDNCGEHLFHEMLGSRSNIFNHIDYATACENVTFLKYEDLVSNTDYVFRNALSASIGDSHINVNLDIKKVNMRTKGSCNRSFFWKASAGTRYEFFSPAQILSFEDEFKNELLKLGYL